MFLGPSALLGLPSNNIFYVALGCTMMGSSLSIGLVPLLSELISILEGEDKYNPTEISDKCSGLFNSMFNMGNLLGPLVAGFLSDWFEYRGTCDIMMVFSLMFTIFFYMTMIFGRKLSFDAEAKPEEN